MPKNTPSTLDTARAAVDKLHARAAEITAEITAARAALASAQSDAIDGKAGASDAVTQAQARLSGAEGTASMLAERITTAEAAARAAERSVEVERITAELARVAAEGGAAHSADADAHDRLRTAFGAAVAEIAEARASISAAHRRFASLLSAAENAGATEAEVIARLTDQGVSADAVRREGYDAHDLDAPPLGHALHLALVEQSQRQAAPAHPTAV